MKILQLITELYPAGAERVVANLAGELRNRGHLLTVVALEPLPQCESGQTAIVDELTAAGIPVRCVDLKKCTPWRLQRLRELFKQCQPDIIHTHLFHANIAGRLLRSAAPNARLINTIHNLDRRPGRSFRSLVERATVKRCDKVTAVSRAAADAFAKAADIESGSIAVIGNGINPPSPVSNVEKCELRRKWQVGNCRIVIGAVGFFSRQKGFDLLLRALCELRSRIPENEDWGVVILGDGGEREKLKKLGQNLPANIHLRLPGFEADAAHAIGAFDLFVMPSRFEGFGLTLVEAMAHGLPIVASDVDAIPELMTGYDNGECIDFNDSRLAARNILDWTKKTEVRTPQSAWSLNTMADKYEELYCSLQFCQ